ncbi:MAG: XdhC family protein [Candidatus Sumerlaeia bacterium]|nr:XdhC family protein [Candidatus Sumerlaeia bacterium]
MPESIYRHIADLLDAGRRCALVTIIQTIGSVPRQPGAKMLVTDEGEVLGTVGGGCVEADLFALAQEALARREILTKTVDLSVKSQDEIDMFCGGKVTAVIEPLEGTPRLVIFGGGHISQALHRICAPLGFHVTVTDDRPRFANEERFPGAETLAMPFERQVEELNLTPATFVVIVTRGHEADEVVLQQVLGKPLRYLGLIGSRSKWKRIRGNLARMGHTEEQLDRVVCPIGLNIHAETPEEIAVAVAAQLIAVKNHDSPKARRHRARSGAAEVSGD